nr:unnamed protein product [Spirometra erinaceieuropaei]
MLEAQTQECQLLNEMKQAEEDRIEREWMDALIASEQERECQERIAKYKVKQEFAKCVHDQLRDKMTLRCGDFQKEKHRCETVVAKELAELQAEKDLALKRKLELRDIFLAELERRRQARKDANKGEHEFILKKQQEMQEIEDFKEYKKELIRSAAEANRQKQVKAADQLVALKAAKAEELNSRAEKAAEQMAIDKTVLHSSMERDDIFREPFERVKKHADFRHELDLNNKWVAERRQLEREADAESTRVYLEACEKQNEAYKHRDQLRKQNGLETGECLRSQIAAKEKEREEEKLEKIAYAKSMVEAMRKLDEEINAEKKKLMDDFTIWKANVFLPAIEEKPMCPNRTEREKRMIANNVTLRISETQDAFGTWQPEKPYHPLVRRA